jgi:CBS domain-containing protein
MPIGTVRTREVVVAMRNTKASEAARLMRKHHVGDVVVVDESGGRQVPCGTCARLRPIPGTRSCSRASRRREHAAP